MEKIAVETSFIDATDKLIAVAQMLDVGAGYPDDFDDTGMIGAGKILLSINNEIQTICEKLNQQINAKRDDEVLEKDYSLFKKIARLRKSGYDVETYLSVYEDERLHIAISQAVKDGLSVNDIVAGIWRTIVAKTGDASATR